MIKPRSVGDDPRPGDLANSHMRLRIVAKVTPAYVWYWQEETSKPHKVSRKTWRKWAVAGGASKCNVGPPPFKIGDIVQTHYWSRFTHNTTRQYVGPYQVTACSAGTFGSCYGIKAVPLQRQCAYCHMTFPRMDDTWRDSSWFCPYTMKRVSPGPWQVCPLAVQEDDIRWIQVVDAHFNVICRVQVAEDSPEQQANLEAIVAIGGGVS